MRLTQETHGEVMKAFGVGCFNLSVASKESKTILVRDYIAEVVKTLKSLTTVSDIEVTYDETVESEELDISPPNPLMKNGQDCYPQIPFFNLQFKIYIPNRVQAELINLPEQNLDTGSENFKVTIIHDWHGPLSYVEPIGAGANTSPSTSVQVIREHLLREIPKTGTYLAADCLGPSPFHADFFLELNDERQNKDSLFSIRVDKNPAYDDITFSCARELFSSEDEALLAIYEDLAQELAFFYDLKLRESGKMNRWTEIQEALHYILDFENKSSGKSIKDVIYKKPKLLRKAFKDIGLYKGQEIFDQSSIRRNYNSIYNSGKYNNYLKEFIDEEISEQATYPIDETFELLRYFDQKASKFFELSIFVLAAILGGFVGSIITVSFS